MPSRRKRKRGRRQAEVTARSPGICGGWGNGVSATLADLVLMRRAINEDWPVPGKVRQAIVDELGDEIDLPDVRRFLAVTKMFLAMTWANLR